jgi:hypothetical protein
MSYAIIISAIIGVAGYLLKYWLDRKSEVLFKKRQVYEEISTALSVFVTGRNSTSEEKKKFLDQYAKLWLWASDSVVRVANEFSDIMMRFDVSDKEWQTRAKRTYANFVIEMRRDLGFSKTLLKSEEYKFVSFGN